MKRTVFFAISVRINYSGRFLCSYAPSEVTQPVTGFGQMDHYAALL